MASRKTCFSESSKTSSSKNFLSQYANIRQFSMSTFAFAPLIIIPFFGKFLPQSRATSSGFPSQNHCESEFISEVSENASTLLTNSGLSARLTSLNLTTARGHSFSRSSRTSCRRQPLPRKDVIWRSSPMIIISFEFSKRLRNNPSSACPHCENSSSMTFGFVLHTRHLAMDEGDMLM